MNHLIILYYIFTLLIGVAILCIALLLLHTSKEGSLRAFICFHSSFTLIAALNLCSTYVKTNVTPEGGVFYSLLRYLENPVALLLVMFTLPWFIHSLLPVKNVHKKNTLIGILVLLLLIANYTSSLFDLAKTLNDARIVIKDTMFLLILAYSWFMLLKHYRTTEDVVNKQYLGGLIVVFGIVIPGIIADTLFLHYPMAKFFPMVYCTVGAYCLRYYCKDISADSATNKGSGLGEASQNIFPHAALVAKYDLTKRESEVMQLVNEGKTYNDIGATLFISVNTVKSHLRKSYQKLGIKNRLDVSHLINTLHNDHNSPSSVS